MSRIGNQPIPLPSNVEVDIDGSDVTIKGPRGSLNWSFNPAMIISREDGVLTV
ncbi:MAG: 50S ribosomal protein L6, partial [Chloroflexi bacterium]|nr:50S ribosomal protein L6 [Chloroflexota bacterium]